MFKSSGGLILGLLLSAMTVLACASLVRAQTFGVELHNTLMPASGAMGGVSIAKPQDLTSALNGNPASLSQFRGTNFTFSGAWAEPTLNLEQSGAIPAIGPTLIDPFAAKSTAPGVPVGNIGVTQDLCELGLPVTLGVGFITTSGAFADYRHVLASRGTNTGLVMFSLPVSAGVELTDRLSVGSSLALGIAFYDGPFVGTGGMTADYALRGSLGVNYALNDRNTIGAFYQTRQSHTFDNAFIINPGLNQISNDVAMDLPENIGFGMANTALLDGRMLLAVDFLYKFWDDAALYDQVYDNQFVTQLGAQYTVGRYRFRGGYVWAQNPIDQSPGLNLGGIVQPGEFRAVRYTQGLLAVTSQNRLSGGLGIADVLPGIDLDLMAGGMFRDSEQLGDFTRTNIQSYWIGMGMTWHFGAGR